MSTDALQTPEVGSMWSHRNGNMYAVLAVANEHADPERGDQYPVLVVYQDQHGKVWARKTSDWHRSMTFRAMAGA